MKRLPVFILLSLVFFSCNQADYLYYFEIINKSSVPISYNYYDSPQVIGAKISDEEPRVIRYDRAYYNAINNITCDGYGIKVKGTHRYKDNYSAIEYIFEDVVPCNLVVVNALPIEVTIKAGEFIEFTDNLQDPPLVSSRLIIPAHGTIPANNEDIAKIYTKKPKFTVIEKDKDSNEIEIEPILYNIEWEYVPIIEIEIDEDPETGEEIEKYNITETVYVIIR